MRFSMGGQQIRKSLGTEDETEAQRRAMEIWHEANYRNKNGLLPQAKPFATVAEEFIEHIRKEAERGERSVYHPQHWPPVIRRYFVGFFGNRAIENIREADLERYLDWRRQYWVTGPGKDIDKIRYERNGIIFARTVKHSIPSLSRQRGELVILRTLFRQANKWGYVGQLEMPEIRVLRRIDNRRPSFTPDEYAKLIQISEQRIYETAATTKHIKAKDGREWTLTRMDRHTMSDRTKLHAYIEIAANTGMRPTEMKNLNWGDVLGFREIKDKPIGEMDIRLRVRGKGKSGTLVPLFGAIPWFLQLWNLFVQECEREPDDADPVFADHKGNRIQSFKKGFGELLKASGLETDHRGVRRTSYSLRHFYISSLIAQGVSVHDVARNTRTSIQMIDKHYAQVSVEQIKDNLRPGQAEW